MNNNGHNNFVSYAHSFMWLWYSSYQKVESIYLSLELGLDHVTCFGQQDIRNRLEKELAHWNLSFLATLRTLRHQVNESACCKGHVENTLPTTILAKSLPTNKHISKAILYYLAPVKPPTDHRDKYSQAKCPLTDSWASDLF